MQVHHLGMMGVVNPLMRKFNILYFNNLVDVGRRLTFEKNGFFSTKAINNSKGSVLIYYSKRWGRGVRRISGDHMVSRGNEGGSVVANRILRGDCKGGNIKILQSLLGKSGILLHTTPPPSYTQPTPPSSSPSNK